MSVNQHLRKTATLRSVDTRHDFWLLSFQTQPGQTHYQHIEVYGKNQAIKTLRRTFNQFQGTGT